MQTKAGTCPECGEKHDPRFPHYLYKPYYRQKFKEKHGRWPTLDDAISHCTATVKKKFSKLFTEELEKRGLKVK